MRGMGEEARFWWVAFDAFAQRPARHIAFEEGWIRDCDNGEPGAELTHEWRDEWHDWISFMEDHSVRGKAPIPGHWPALSASILNRDKIWLSKDLARAIRKLAQEMWDADAEERMANVRELLLPPEVSRVS